MRLKTKLVVSATGLTFAIVPYCRSCLSASCCGRESSRRRTANDVLAHEVFLMTRQAVETGLRANPPSDPSDEALQAAVIDALRNNDSLDDVMSAIMRYSPTVQDISVTDARGITLVSTDPDACESTSATAQQSRESAVRQHPLSSSTGLRKATGVGYRTSRWIETGNHS